MAKRAIRMLTLHLDSSAVLRLVSAAGFRGEQVAGHGIGTSAGSAANRAYGTASALAFQPGAVAQGDKQGRIGIQLSQRLGHDIARGERQEAARIYLALVVNEDESLAVVHSFGRARNDIGLGQAPARLPGALLQNIALIMLALGGLDFEMNHLGCGIELGEDLFMLIGIEHFTGLFLARRNEEKYIPQNNIQAREQFDHGSHVMEVPARDDGIDLHRELHFMA